MEAPKRKITLETSYNLAEVVFQPKDIGGRTSRNYYPDFQVKIRAPTSAGNCIAWPNSQRHRGV